MARQTKRRVAAENTLSLDNLADMSGLTIDELRAGGSAFFHRLGTTRMKLMGAMVAASTASGANPQKFIRLLANLAEQLEPEKQETDDKLVRLSDHRR